MTATLHELRHRYLDAQLSGDRDAALAVLDGAVARGLGVADLEIDVIGAAQREIGRLWEENAISVADEHEATAISQLALAHLYRHLAGAPRNGRTVVLACVEGELHDMGPRIAGDQLDAAGFTVRFLGASVPAGEVVRRAVEARADLVALSATLPLHLPALREAVAHLRASLGDAVPLVLGGPAAAHAGLEGPGVHVSSGSARELVEAVARILGVAP